METTSKTQRKREALSLQELGEKLVGLSEQQLREIELPEDMRTQIKLARTITKHGGRKRQMQYIGVLMRRIDVEPIREAIRFIEEGRSGAAHRHQQVEVWRDELISGNDAVLDDVLMKFPMADRVHLTQLVQDARDQKTRPHPASAASRALFRYLHSLTESR
jgi:ribosome-associated protein